MRGIVFCTSPIVFQAESTKTHLERTLHINSLYDNLDPGSYTQRGQFLWTDNMYSRNCVSVMSRRLCICDVKKVRSSWTHDPRHEQKQAFILFAKSSILVDPHDRMLPSQRQSRVSAGQTASWKSLRSAWDHHTTGWRAFSTFVWATDASA